MAEINDGGPAFPWCGDLNECPTINLGMSLRDWFAGQALMTLIEVCRYDSILGGDYAAHCARNAYEMADAMLAARGGDNG